MRAFLACMLVNALVIVPLVRANPPPRCRAMI
jgi:hypothetical protein